VILDSEVMLGILSDLYLHGEINLRELTTNIQLNICLMEIFSLFLLCV